MEPSSPISSPRWHSFEDRGEIRLRWRRFWFWRRRRSTIGLPGQPACPLAGRAAPVSASGRLPVLGAGVGRALLPLELNEAQPVELAGCRAAVAGSAGAIAPVATAAAIKPAASNAAGFQGAL